MYIQCIYIYICILFNKYIYIIIYTYTALHYITTLYCHLPIGCSMGVTRLEINRWKRTYTTVVIIPLLCVLSMSTSTFIYMYMHRYVYVYVYLHVCMQQNYIYMYIHTQLHYIYIIYIPMCLCMNCHNFGYSPCVCHMALSQQLTQSYGSSTGMIS